MPYARASDGTRLHYETAGRDKRGAPALILVHGYAGNETQWQPAGRLLARTHRVVRFDLRGHGRSDAPSSGYTIRQLADDLATVARSSRMRRAVIAGHSLGSAVALAAASRHASLVAGVVLIDGAMDQWATAATVERNDLYRTLADQPHPDGLAQLYAMFYPDPRDAELSARLIEEATRTDERAALQTWRASLTADIPALASRVRQPALYISRSRRPLVTAEQLREVMPDAEYAQAHDCGHFVQLEAPDQVAAMVRRFLDRSVEA
jgi:pimeloyl-ACP methyl ester carboxylesterase